MFARELLCYVVWLVVLCCLCSSVCAVVFTVCASLVLYCVMPCSVVV